MAVVCTFWGAILVSISACHAEDPGSIPDRRVYLLHKNLFGKATNQNVADYDTCASTWHSAVQKYYDQATLVYRM